MLRPTMAVIKYRIVQNNISKSFRIEWFSKRRWPFKSKWVECKFGFEGRFDRFKTLKDAQGRIDYVTKLAQDKDVNNWDVIEYTPPDLKLEKTNSVSPITRNEKD